MNKEALVVKRTGYPTQLYPFSHSGRIWANKGFAHINAHFGRNEYLPMKIWTDLVRYNKRVDKSTKILLSTRPGTFYSVTYTLLAMRLCQGTNPIPLALTVIMTVNTQTVFS